MQELYPVALVGFDDFERSALAFAFKLSQRRQVAYSLVDALPDCRFAVADTDSPGSLDAVRAARRLRNTVFIGPQAPAAAQAWLMRPLDPSKVVHELDLLAARSYRETRPAPLFAELPGMPLPGVQVMPAPGGRPVSSDGLGRRQDDALGAVPRPGRSDRRS